MFYKASCRAVDPFAIDTARGYTFKKTFKASDSFIFVYMSFFIFNPQI